MAHSAQGTVAYSPVAGILSRARVAQERWAAQSIRERLRAIARFRAAVAARAELFAAAVDHPAAHTLTAEVLPLAEACRFLERHAEELLASRRIDSYTPMWLRSVDLVTRREPFGVILIIGPSNYPTFLPGVQVVQALAAGNAVMLKPGRASTKPAQLLMECAAEAGVPPDVAVLLDESVESATEAIQIGVDKVLTTGSKETGRAVLSSLGDRVTPAVAELSGHDPVFVLDDADIRLAASAIHFGANLNEGNTCIRPRVVYGSAQTLKRLRAELQPEVSALEFVPVETPDEAVRLAARSEYALGATVFGTSDRAARFAESIRAGVVVINDMIMPTAHPAVAFGGRGASGYGVTRGAEGLLELTTLKTVITQRSPWRPHLQPPQPGDARMFAAFIRMLHGRGLTNRLRGFVDMLNAGRTRGREIN